MFKRDPNRQVDSPKTRRPLSCWMLYGLLMLPWLATGLPSHRLLADDWPQWMGPQRDSVYRETGIVAKIPASGLKVLWRKPIASGYAGPAVASGRVYVMDYVKSSGQSTNNPGSRDSLSGSERILCIDSKTGDEIWKIEYERPYHISYPNGPRATPTIDGDRVYTLGAEGNLYCLDVSSGATIW